MLNIVCGTKWWRRWYPQNNEVFYNVPLNCMNSTFFTQKCSQLCQQVTRLCASTNHLHNVFIHTAKHRQTKTNTDKQQSIMQFSSLFHGIVLFWKQSSSSAAVLFCFPSHSSSVSPAPLTCVRNYQEQHQLFQCKPFAMLFEHFLTLFLSSKNIDI